MTRFMYFFPFTFMLLPYFGTSLGRVGVYGIFSSFLLSSSLAIFLSNPRSVPRLTITFAAPVFVFCVSMINQVVFINTVGFFDLAEILKPISYTIYFCFGFILGKKYGLEKIVQFLTWYLFILIILNFTVAFGPFLVPSIADYSELFGLGREYTAGYARFRAFGIAGQPGILGMLCNIIHILLCFILCTRQTKSRSSRSIILFLIFLNACVLVSSFSRISLGFFILNNIFVFYMYKEIRPYFRIIMCLVFFGCLYFVEVIIQLIPFMLRGVDLSSGNFGTLSMRLDYKILILDLLSEHQATSLFGIGPSKEFLQAPIRHPDSSFSLFLLRFGILGHLLYILPILFITLTLLLVTFKKVNLKFDIISRYYLRAVLLISTYLLLKAQLEPAYSDVKLSFIAFTIFGIAIAASRTGKGIILNTQS